MYCFRIQVHNSKNYYLRSVGPFCLTLWTLKTSTATLDVMLARCGVWTSTPLTRNVQVPSWIIDTSAPTSWSPSCLSLGVLIMFYAKPSLPDTMCFLVLASGLLMILGSHFIIMKSSEDSRLDVARTWCTSFRCHPDPVWQYQETFRMACDAGLWNPKVVLKVHVHTQNDVEFRVRSGLDIWMLQG